MEFASLMIGPVDVEPRGDTFAADRPENVAGTMTIRLDSRGVDRADCLGRACPGRHPMMFPSNRVRIIMAPKRLNGEMAEILRFKTSTFAAFGLPSNGAGDPRRPRRRSSILARGSGSSWLLTLPPTFIQRE